MQVTRIMELSFVLAVGMVIGCGGNEGLAEVQKPVVSISVDGKATDATRIFVDSMVSLEAACDASKRHRFKLVGVPKDSTATLTSKVCEAASFPPLPRSSETPS
jgi:hypothetical protein